MRTKTVLTALFSIIALGGCVVVQAQTPAPQSYPVVGRFNDLNEVFYGRIYEKSTAGESVIELQGNVTGMKCYGSSYATQIPNHSIDCEGLEGEAKVSCDDGRIIAGKWKAVGCRKGVAVGVDQNNNQLTFVYGMTENEAQTYINELAMENSSRPSVPPVYRPKETRKEKGFSTGTGFFVTASGHIITNYHVIDGSNQLFVITTNGTKMRARYLKGDPINDVAILKVEYSSRPLAIIQENKLSIGDEVFTLGYPLIMSQGQEQKATFGHVNSLSGLINNGNNDLSGDIRFIQIDVPIQPGNSGGPLLNDRGQVTGVVTATLDTASTISKYGYIPQNVNYAVKSDYIVPLIRTQLGNSWSSATSSVNGRTKTDIIKDAQDSVVLIVALAEEAQQVHNATESRHSVHDSTAPTPKAVTDSPNGIKQEVVLQRTNNPEALQWSNKSLQSVQQGQWVESIRCANVAISLDPGLPDPYINRAWAYAEKGFYEKALEDANTALKIDPYQSTAVNNRGLTYLRMGQKEKAIKDYRKACEMGLDVSCKNFSEIVGYLPSEEIPNLLKFSNDSFTKGDYDRVLFLSSKVIELEPYNAEAYSNRCGAKATLGHLDEAKVDCQKAIKYNPDFSMAYNNLGFALEKEGKKEEAVIQYEISCGLKNDLGCKNQGRLAAGSK